MSQPVIHLQQTTRHYQMGATTVYALRQLDLTIQEGEFIVLLGPSGSGKTTTLNLIGGLDQPSSGQILFRGTNIAAYSPSQLTLYRRQQIGFIFQFFNLVPTLTAAENIEFALKLDKQNKRNAPAKALELLKLVGLDQRATHFPAELSGGEQQRVAIARALANQPALLLCDEPTGNLDIETGQQVLQTLRDFNQKQRTTVILVTHNTAIAPMADRIIRLRDGQIDHIETNPNPSAVADLAW
ncbi:MAG TPA: ABC transporter ATP-binding protein [Anaerolineae bacterium]|nr:ABC transporter ATP-binding protein [Anaerolineae bacterium]